MNKEKNRFLLRVFLLGASLLGAYGTSFYFLGVGLRPTIIDWVPMAQTRKNKVALTTSIKSDTKKATPIKSDFH